MRTIPFLLAGVILASASFLAAGCGGDDNESAGQPTNGGATEPPAPIELIARDFSFAPDQLEGFVGESFQVELINHGDEAHTFTIDEFDVDETVAAGEEASVVVTPSEPGEFTFYCKFHQASGMIGSIAVGTAQSRGAAPPSRPPGEDTGDGGSGY